MGRAVFETEHPGSIPGVAAPDFKTTPANFLTQNAHNFGRFTSIFTLRGLIVRSFVRLVRTVIHRRRRIAVHAGMHMAVDRERNRQGRMSEHLAHLLGIDAYQEQERRCGMAQIILIVLRGYVTSLPAETGSF